MTPRLQLLNKVAIRIQLYRHEYKHTMSNELLRRVIRDEATKLGDEAIEYQSDMSVHALKRFVSEASVLSFKIKNRYDMSAVSDDKLVAILEESGLGYFDMHTYSYNAMTKTTFSVTVGSHKIEVVSYATTKGEIGQLVRLPKAVDADVLVELTATLVLIGRVLHEFNQEYLAKRIDEWVQLW